MTRINTLKLRAKHFKKQLILLLLLATCWNLGWTQTDFALGDIAITGYQADTPDKLTAVFLVDVEAGTTFTMTDNGWLATGGFRPNEGTMAIEITEALPCGTEVVFVLQAPAFRAVAGFLDVEDGDGNIVGSITSISGNISFSASGDQLFIYQGTTPTLLDQSSFITAIQMNGDWDGDATSSNTSAQPVVFMDGVNSISIAPEIDNAVVNCDSLGDLSGSAAELAAAIYSSTWDTNNSIGLDIPASCDIACDVCSPPTVTCPADNFMLPMGCNPMVPAPDTALLVVENGCGLVTKEHVGDVTVDVGCTRTITRTYRATDENRDSDECTQTFTFTFDPEGPTLSEMPGAITVECDAIPAAPTITATDNCADIAQVIFINEFHYDNDGTDTGEFIEVAGSAGFDLSTCQLVLYNGNGGAPYNTINLSGMIDNEGAGFGAVDFQLPTNGLQNGSPDGFALVCDGEVLEFLSYEGTFTAVGGPADGMLSTDVGVQETDDPPLNQSLQKIGMMGCPGTDFTWTGPVPESPGTINDGQTFDLGACPQTNEVPVMFTETSAAGTCAQEQTITRTWMATDACGTTTMHMQIITVEDNTAPVFCDPPMSIEVTCEIPAVEDVVAIDACDFGTVTQIAWINEIHYDNAGADVGEFIEIAGRAGTDLAGYQLLAYDSDNMLDAQVVLSGVIPNEGCGFGAISFTLADLNSQFFENGPSEGRALMQTGVGIIDFISYEGTVTAADGPAMGLTSTNIGVVEVSGTPAGLSVQLTGAGAASADFTWIGPTAESPGTLNTDQTIATPDGLMVTFMEVGDPDPCTGGTVTRTWTATDACGNADSHEQVITLLPAPGPSITCPADEVVSCFEDINADPGLVTATAGCGAIVSIYVKQPLITGGIPGCDGTVYTYIYKAVDECGNVAQCEQQFIIENNAPTLTVPADATVNCADEIEVSESDATVTTDCAGDFRVNVLGPVVEGSANCPGTTYTYTYRVKDFCNRIVEAERVFTIGNNGGPIITSVPLNGTAECEAGPSLQQFAAESSCGGEVETSVSDPVVIGTPGCNGSRLQYTYTATDACGRTATHVQTITIQNAGPVIDCPETLQIFNCEDGDKDALIEAWIASVSATSACGGSLDVRDNYNGNAGMCINNGFTNVTFFATDQCGRTTSCVGTIIITDTEAPIIYQAPTDVLVPCNGVTQDRFNEWLSNQGGAEAIDGCWGDNITWSTNPPNPQVSCDNGPEAIVVEFIARDGCGNTASVTGIFNTKIQPDFIEVAGQITREDTEPVADVQLEVTGGTAGVPEMDYTAIDGVYGFPELEYEDNLNLVPEKNIDPLNGLTTYDLILLQKHILGNQLLDSPYKMIAGDINRSGHISTLDMIHLRRMILFVDENFQNNTSWRFVEASYVFPNEANPFEATFPEVYNLNGEAEEAADFIGVKIGDLNLDAIANELMEVAEERTNLDKLSFKVKDENLVAGTTHQIDFTAENFDQINGFQFTLNLGESLELVDVQTGELVSFGAENYGLSKLANGAITVSWNENSLVNLRPEAVVFSLMVKAKQTIQLSKALAISSEYTRAEAYGVSELMNVDLLFEQNNSLVIMNEFALFQNQPNPFKSATMIGFNLPESGNVALMIYDVSGRLIYNERGTYTEGYNQINLDRSNLPASGIFYYHVITDKDSASKKMILMD